MAASTILASAKIHYSTQNHRQENRANSWNRTELNVKIPGRLFFLTGVSVALLSWQKRLTALALRATMDTNSRNLTHNVDGPPKFDREKRRFK
jgi:hypothetical protein